MKVRPSVKPMCEKCKIIKRHGRVMVICENPKHMARIAGIDLPRDKRIEIGLTYIFGIGRKSASDILKMANVDPDIRVKDLTADQESALREVIDKHYTIEGDLRRDVAMDIKNSPQRYAEACGGVDILSEVQESVLLLQDSPTDYEFRTTVCKPLHTEKEMEEIGRWLKGAKRYFLQPFVNSGNLVSGGVQAHTRDELTRLQKAVLPYILSTQMRGI